MDAKEYSKWRRGFSFLLDWGFLKISVSKKKRIYMEERNLQNIKETEEGLKDTTSPEK